MDRLLGNAIIAYQSRLPRRDQGQFSTTDFAGTGYLSDNVTSHTIRSDYD